ncbi:MAG: YlxR family protein [Oscillospiraceae bacterium]|nr:YlxR family protein [Oscillospiraceae bacterium]
MKNKKQPERMCLGCREMKLKKELIRIVRSAEGEISIDRTGKKSGRGAYICPEEKCLKNAIKQNALEKTFSQKISDEIYNNLTKELLGG